MYVRSMYVFMYVCMYVCIYVCIYVTFIFPSHNSYERDDSGNEDCRVIACKVRVRIS